VKGRARPNTIDLTRADLARLLEHAQPSLTAVEYEQLRAALDTLVVMMNALAGRNATIARLRQMLFGGSSEKTAALLKSIAGARLRGSADSAQTAADPTAGEGHGRMAATDYPGATVLSVPHPQLHAGERCPDCARGTLHALAASPLVRISGQAPLTASVYELAKLRCSGCQKVFTAPSPEGVGAAKYDAQAAAMIALLKYGSGMPFHRLEGLQANLGVPLPASTQWEIVRDAHAPIRPVYRELVRQAAQGQVLHNDDTTARILELMPARQREEAAGPPDAAEVAAAIGARVKGGKSAERSGIFTSGIVSTGAGRTIALFFTGRRHAGENLGEVLAQRNEELEAPIQMCDALSRNFSGEYKTILAHCIAHSRRKYVEAAPSFPSQCLYVIDLLAEVYRIDAQCRRDGLMPTERMQRHQELSHPLMDKLYAWMQEQFDQRLVEPASGLGEAIEYMRKHWERLTLFLRKPGAPLDNNSCEQALKRAILHRKNALFYRTSAGAQVGDAYMSLIHTCGLAKVNAFEYLTALNANAQLLAADPAAWMPWTFRQSLTRIADPRTAPPCIATSAQAQPHPARASPRAD
jgi:transposase